jgi:hypothetical protein
MKHPYFNYPFAIILLVFTLDKITMIDFVWRNGRTENTPLENVRDGMDLIWKDRIKNPSSKKVVVFFGTSRTENLRYLANKNILSSKELTQIEKENLLNYDFEMRGIVRASEILYNYTLLEGLIQSGYRPDVVFFELSPEMFNRNNPFHASFQSRDNIFLYSQLLKILSSAEWNWKRNILTAVLFPASHYNFSIIKFLKSSISGTDYLTDNFVIPFFLASSSIQEYEPKPEIHEDIIDGELYQTRILQFSEYLKNENILRNYEYSTSESKLLDYTIALASSSNIKVVFWRPRLHMYYNQMLKDQGLGKVDLEFADKVKKSGHIYIDMQNISLNCDYFIDSSHFAPSCAPEIVSKLLELSSTDTSN